MVSFRIIPRLDLKNDTVIKGIRLEGLRVVGEPVALSQQYARDGADELVCMDAVASLYNRAPQPAVIARIASELDVPLTVGGGIRSVEDARTMLLAGADKIAVNSAAVRRPALLSELAHAYGAQCVVLSVETRRVGEGKWTVFVDAGREKTEKDALDWIAYACTLGVGEILLTSIDHEGMMDGYDLPLIRAVAARCTIPIITHGGADTPQAMHDAWKAGASGASTASMLHYKHHTVHNIRQALAAQGIPLSLSPDQH